MEQLIAFWNSDRGRRLVKWGMTSFGALISTGVLPLDTPIFGHFSLGGLLLFLGYNVSTGQMNAEARDANP